MSTPSPSTATTTVASAPSLLVQFEHYIDGLLLDNDKPDSQTDTQGADNQRLLSPNKGDNVPTDTQATAIKRKVLWVTESADYAQAQTELQDQDIELINIDMLSQSPPTERYELICFWLPSLKDAEFKTYLATLMHSRDLYAEYTLIVLADSIDLVAYGFVHLNGSPLDAVNDNNTTENKAAENNTADNNTTLINSDEAKTTQGQRHQLRAWQFNLFDYKPRPHWLNAHYWANPENWGKYRW